MVWESSYDFCLSGSPAGTVDIVSRQAGLMRSSYIVVKYIWQAENSLGEY